ncbi:hypothetical protein [Trichocoleus sp. FACHB-262]|uniref:hypothetical protein n=1 Tax=Trichocoleus sp. FACHB-262 TaxID=2692869 RepID=UPI0016895F5C|nr:hypothetical protein [Trichocoleus sp. FACHB-262]MBD2123303.1 hypothetical protein [Trichocoleus sp. FACHB-262]
MSAVPALRRLTRVALIVPFVVASLEPFAGSASAQVTPLGAKCPVGTTLGADNLVFNGNYSILGGGAEPNINPAAGFSSDLPYRGDAVYPDDRGVNGPLGPEGPLGGISIQTGPVTYANGVVVSRQEIPVFPGDPANGAPASNTFLYSNPNEDLQGRSLGSRTDANTFSNPTIWQQTVTVTPNTTYNFIAYFDNLLSATADPRAVNPEIQLQIKRGNTAFDLGPQISVPRSAPNGLGGEWLPVQFSFTTLPTDTNVTLAIVDRANTVNGDDFGHTAIGLRQCLPNIGIAKAAGTAVSNSDGTFTVPYSLTVRNYGADAISNLQVTDDLATTFANAAGFVVSGAQSPTLSVNPNFNGSSDRNILAPGNTLAATGQPGDTATITFNVTITPGAGPQGLGPFNNSAIATGNAGNTTVQDTSDAGTNPDQNGNGIPNEPGENDPTSVTLTATPKIGVAKQAGAAVDNGNGVFTVPYTVTVSNLGNVSVNNLQLAENLTTTFGPPTTFTIAAAPTSSTLAVNPAFNGNSDSNLLAGTTALAVGQTATVTFSVQVTANGQLGPFNNTVLGTGTGPGGTPAQDESTNGANPDPNGDGIPEERQPTVVSFGETPKLGVAKQAGAVVNSGNGVFTVPYTVTVSNLGNVPINNLRLVENLTSTFGPPTTFTITAAPTSPTLAVNSAFNGNSDPNLLAGTTNLAVGQTATVTFSVQVAANGQPGPFNNTVTGIGTSPGGTDIQDESTNGTNPDPNGDGIPEERQPTPVQPEPLPVGEPQLRLLKRITAVEQGGRTQTFDRFVDDPTDTTDTAPGWAQLSPVGEVNLPTSLSLRSGDSVEYTLYFLSDGTAPATAASLCDPIPARTTFARDRFGTGSGLQLNRASAEKSLTNNADTDEGNFFTPLAPLPNGNACPANAQGNTNGSVIVNLGEISNTPGQNFGFVRFRVRID